MVALLAAARLVALLLLLLAFVAELLAAAFLLAAVPLTLAVWLGRALLLDFTVAVVADRVAELCRRVVCRLVGCVLALLARVTAAPLFAVDGAAAVLAPAEPAPLLMMCVPVWATGHVGPWLARAAI